MIIVNKSQFNKLVEAGLINFSKYNKNFTTINRQKKSRRHKYAVVETREIIDFFNKNNV